MKLPRAAENLIPAYARRPLLAALLMQFAVYWGSKAIAHGWQHHDMTTALDGRVPLLPWTVVIYVGAYVFWAVNYVLAARQGEDRAARFLAADALGKLAAFVLFLALPTTNVRPDIPAGAPLGGALGILYALDTPEALFPSLHCFCSWLCWAGVRGQKEIPAPYRAFSLVFALAVAASTLTTRQHVLADVPAGIALAELCWQLAGHTPLARWYWNLWGRKPVFSSRER